VRGPPGPSPGLPERTFAALVDGLAAERHAFAPGAAVAAWLGVGPQQWADFAGHWDRLGADRHMNDGGTYRQRRYGAFSLRRPGLMQLLPHGPYEQPLYINPLNGGVPREFDPLEPSFAGHVVLASLLAGLADVFDAIECATQRWTVRLHPYRIRADMGTPGLPTPEGLHRDGVDHIVTMMVRRRNVEGGATLVTDEARRRLWEHTLGEPMDLHLADDLRTMHAVTPIVCATPRLQAFRDVLVVAFSRAFP
jgi:hypothetical protein